MRKNPGHNACLDAFLEGPYAITEKLSPVNDRIVRKKSKFK